jgi:hypothetical protein
MNTAVEPETGAGSILGEPQPVTGSNGLIESDPAVTVVRLRRLSRWATSD